jgi:hypothetical protein
MTMGINDIADGFVRARANGCEQLPALAHAAAGIDHGDRLIADDKADIGDGAVIIR